MCAQRRPDLPAWSNRYFCKSLGVVVGQKMRGACCSCYVVGHLYFFRVLAGVPSRKGLTSLTSRSPAVVGNNILRFASVMLHILPLKSPPNVSIQPRAATPLAGLANYKQQPLPPSLLPSSTPAKISYIRRRSATQPIPYRGTQTHNTRATRLTPS